MLRRPAGRGEAVARQGKGGSSRKDREQQSNGEGGGGEEEGRRRDRDGEGEVDGGRGGWSAQELLENLLKGAIRFGVNLCLGSRVGAH